MSIRFFSTNGNVPHVPVGSALLQGQAGDKGLFMPEAVPALSAGLLGKARDLAYPDLAVEILWPYVEGTFTRPELEEICHSAYDFDIPLENVTGNRHVMRLDQGPTASFKDFAARFMGRALGRLVKARRQGLLILTATSGDTGSAVASAFMGVEGIEVLVLFPEKEVSPRQRKQMTTLGGNISTLALPGKFDDCQALVKQAFADRELADLNLSSANSINIGRLLPQSVYYTWAASRVADIAGGQKVVFSIPSGNFGDMMGGMLAMHGGLPIEKFVIATNANDEVPLFLETGSYSKLVPSRVCISNAMNVGHPSNLARLVSLYGGQMDETGKINTIPDMEKMQDDLFAVSISDEETRATIKAVFEDYDTMLEPHGAVGWAGLTRYLDANPSAVTAISLETAHPAKFPDEIRALTGREPDLPPSLQGIEELTEQYGELPVDYDAFKAHLVKEYR
ncbi:MAG: threonine synthase [Gemmatimonadales bacterium]|nr:threonine synthase [Gemmatimonadales bacterium]